MHHQIAWLVAQGERNYAISAATGYTESRISILKADPSFQELVAGYAKEVAEIRRDSYAEAAAKMHAIHMDTLDEIHARTLDAPELIQHRDLLDQARQMADRTGFGPMTKSASVNMNLDIAGQLAEGRARGDRLIAAVPAAKAARETPPELLGGPAPESQAIARERAEGPSGIDHETFARERPEGASGGAHGPKLGGP